MGRRTFGDGARASTTRTCILLVPHLKLLLIEELDVGGGAQVAQYIKMLINGLQVSRDIPEAGPF